MKFATQLSSSNKELLGSRAQLFANQVKLEQETLVNDLRRKVMQCEGEMQQLTDLGPNTSVDLRVGSGTNAADWPRKMQAKKIELLNLKVELQLAEATTLEWFTEEAKPVTTPAASSAE